MGCSRHGARLGVCSPLPIPEALNRLPSSLFNGTGALSSAEAARRLGVTARHFRRLLAKFRLEGDAAAVHGLRGRPSNRALPRSLRERALDMARDPLREDFGPTLLAEHLERETGRRAGVETLRRWMMQAGLWERRRKRAKHRSRRPRRLALGELAQWDSSVHRWLEDRYPGELVLISIHDDATNRLMAAKFARKDDGAENRRSIIDYLETHGRPLAVYTNRAGHFGQKRSKGKPRTESIISRALAELDVEMILAGSPQAKGRVERSFGTAQDRLVKEMRVAGISTIKEANRYLKRTWMPLWNERFAKEPGEPVDAHRPLPEGFDDGKLEAALFSCSSSVGRRLEPDWALIHRELARHKGMTLQRLWLEYLEANPDGYR